MDQASLSLTTRVIGGPRNPQAPALASVCSLGPRSPTTSRGIFEIDRQGNLLYSPGTDRIARAGYLDLECRTRAPGTGGSLQPVQDADAPSPEAVAQYCADLRQEAQSSRSYYRVCYADGSFQMNDACQAATNHFIERRDTYFLQPTIRARLAAACTRRARPSTEAYWVAEASRLSALYESEMNRLYEQPGMTGDRFREENAYFQEFGELKNRIADWCLQNMCECRGSRLAILLSFSRHTWGPPIRERIARRLALEEQELIQRYVGRPSDLASDCPASPQGTFIGYLQQDAIASACPNCLTF